jgi:hypothetical protein
MKQIKLLKIILLLSLPVAFFMYSMLLLPIVLLYGILLFPIKKIESNTNYGVKKELAVKIPKIDCVAAIALVVVVISVVSISALTTGTQGSTYAGKSEAQVYEMLVDGGMSSSTAETQAREIIRSGRTLTRGERIALQSCTLLTGQRELFLTRNRGAESLGNNQIVQRSSGGNTVTAPGSGGGGGDGGVGDGTLKLRQPDGSVSYHTGAEADRLVAEYRANNGLSQVPLTQTVTQIFKTLSYGMLILIFGGGIFMLIRAKKIPKKQNAKRKRTAIA